MNNWYQQWHAGLHLYPFLLGSFYLCFSSFCLWLCKHYSYVLLVFHWLLYLQISECL